jgi:hypothetical protein
MHKKNLHPNAADFQLKKKEKREKRRKETHRAAGFAALTANEFAGFFFSFSHGFGDF